MVSAVTIIDDRERLLDHFPLSADELDRILGFYESYKEDKTIAIDNAFFERYLPEVQTLLRRAVETVFVVATSPKDPLQNEFLEACVSLLGRRGEICIIDIIFDVVAAEKQAGTSQPDNCNVQPPDKADTKKLMDLLYRIAYISLMSEHKESAVDHNLVPSQGWIQAPSAEKTISRLLWKQWVREKANHLHLAVSGLFHAVLLGPRFTMKPSGLCLPSATCGIARQQAIQLATMGLGGTWWSLYNSHEHGLSFPAFHQALLGYTGTTMILITTTCGEILGYFSQVPWKSWPKWYTEEGDSFLFSLYPRWSIYGLKCDNDMNKKYHQFLYTPVSTNGKKDNLHGLGVGGVAADSPRLHVTLSLERCLACRYDVTFESGNLLASDDNSFFDIEHLQIFAVESSEQIFLKNLESGQRQTALREMMRQRLAQVDRRQFVEDFATGAFINHLYDHREQTRGRASFCADDEEGYGYFIEGKRPSHADIRDLPILDNLTGGPGEDA